jgi:hypothetical protein
MSQQFTSTYQADFGGKDIDISKASEFSGEAQMSSSTPHEIGQNNAKVGGISQDINNPQDKDITQGAEWNKLTSLSSSHPLHRPEDKNFGQEENQFGDEKNVDRDITKGAEWSGKAQISSSHPSHLPDSKKFGEK